MIFERAFFYERVARWFGVAVRAASVNNQR
jgi:hypothetical protein